jgi:hypothetical protein
MRSRTIWIIGTLCIAVPAYFAFPILWPVGMDAPEPSAAAGVLWTAVSFAKALAFGWGVMFLLFGYPFLRRIERESAAWTVPLHISIAWLLLSWLPAAALHGAPERTGSGNTWLLALHLSVIAATGVVAQRFLTNAGAPGRMRTRNDA